MKFCVKVTEDSPEHDALKIMGEAAGYRCSWRRKGPSYQITYIVFDDTYGNWNQNDSGHKEAYRRNNPEGMDISFLEAMKRLQKEIKNNAFQLGDTFKIGFNDDGSICISFTTEFAVNEGCVRIDLEKLERIVAEARSYK